MPLRADSPATALSAALLLACAAGVPIARANELHYRIAGQPVVIVKDGDPADLDPLPNRIKVNFGTVAPVGTATIKVVATLIAQADPPATGTPILRFDRLTISNVSGNVMGGTMWVEHHFKKQTPPGAWTARMAGRFDSLITPGTLGGASLNHLSRVYSDLLGWKTIVNLGTGLMVGAAPIPFVLAGGPFPWDQVRLQRTDLAFYLDSPGDAIIVQPADNSVFHAVLLPLLALPAARRRRAAQQPVPSLDGLPALPSLQGLPVE